MRQLESVSRRLLAGLAAQTPVLADANVMAHLDINSTQRRVYGHAKADAGFDAAKVGGYSLRLRGLNPLLAAVSTPPARRLGVGTRLRGGTANSARGAESFVAEAITTARAAKATALMIARMDSAFYGGAPIAACRRDEVRCRPELSAGGGRPDQGCCQARTQRVGGGGPGRRERQRRHRTVDPEPAPLQDAEQHAACGPWPCRSQPRTSSAASSTPTARFIDAFPDLHHAIEKLVTGDDNIWALYTMPGTHLDHCAAWSPRTNTFATRSWAMY